MNKQVAVKILQAARGRLEKGWTQRPEARDVDGSPVDAWDKSATSFCLLGSLVPSSMELQGQEEHLTNAEVRYLITDSIKKTIHPEEPSLVNIALFNDSPSCTKEKVLDVMDRTITRLQAEVIADLGSKLLDEKQYPETD